MGQIVIRTDPSTNSHMDLQKPFRGWLVRFVWRPVSYAGGSKYQKTQKDFLVYYLDKNIKQALQSGVVKA
jgi:hypothetical protein